MISLTCRYLHSLFKARLLCKYSEPAMEVVTALNRSQSQKKKERKCLQIGETTRGPGAPYPPSRERGQPTHNRGSKWLLLPRCACLTRVNRHARFQLCSSRLFCLRNTTMLRRSYFVQCRKNSGGMKTSVHWGDIACSLCKKAFRGFRHWQKEVTDYLCLQTRTSNKQHR